MPPTVRNGDVDHRPLGIVLPFQGLVTAPIATRDYPFPAIDVRASDGNSRNSSSGLASNDDR